MLAAELNFVIAALVQAVFIDKIATLYRDRPRLSRAIVGLLVALTVVGVALGSLLVAYTIGFITHGSDFDSTSVAYKWRCVDIRSPSLTRAVSSAHSRSRPPKIC